MGIFEELADAYTYNGSISLKALEDDIITLENQIDSYDATIRELNIRKKKPGVLIEKRRDARIRLSLLKTFYKREKDKDTTNDVILNMLGISANEAKEEERVLTAAEGREPKPQNFESSELEVSEDFYMEPESSPDYTDEYLSFRDDVNFVEPENYDAFYESDKSIYASFDLTDFTDMVNTDSVKGYYDNDAKTLTVIFKDIRDHSIFMKLLKERTESNSPLSEILRKPRNIFMDVHEKVGETVNRYRYEFMDCKVKEAHDSGFISQRESTQGTESEHECAIVFKYRKLRIL